MQRLHRGVLCIPPPWDLCHGLNSVEWGRPALCVGCCLALMMKLLQKAGLPYRRRPSKQDFDFSNMDEYQYDVEGESACDALGTNIWWEGGSASGALGTSIRWEGGLARSAMGSSIRWEGGSARGTLGTSIRWEGGSAGGALCTSIRWDGGSAGGALCTSKLFYKYRTRIIHAVCRNT